jgi:hypothetical protein
VGRRPGAEVLGGPFGPIRAQSCVQRGHWARACRIGRHAATSRGRRDFKDGTLRGNEAKPDGFGPNAIKEQVLDSSKLNAAKIGKVPGAALADGLTRHGVISSAGTPVRGRGVTSAAKTGDGQYQVIFDVDVRSCTYFATLGDESASAPGTGQISVTSAASNVNGVRVVTRNSAGDANVDRSFHLTVSC